MTRLYWTYAGDRSDVTARPHRTAADRDHVYGLSDFDTNTVIGRLTRPLTLAEAVHALRTRFDRVEFADPENLCPELHEEVR